MPREAVFPTRSTNMTVLISRKTSNRMRRGVGLSPLLECRLVELFGRLMSMRENVLNECVTGRKERKEEGGV
jgi:hypothetical protein